MPGTQKQTISDEEKRKAEMRECMAQTFESLAGRASRSASKGSGPWWLREVLWDIAAKLREDGGEQRGNKWTCSVCGRVGYSERGILPNGVCGRCYGKATRPVIEGGGEPTPEPIEAGQGLDANAVCRWLAEEARQMLWESQKECCYGQRAVEYEALAIVARAGVIVGKRMGLGQSRGPGGRKVTE